MFVEIFYIYSIIFSEFVHGDFGRTEPSVGDLLGLDDVDILELDVEAVDLAWPPKSGWPAVEERIIRRKILKKRRRSSSEEDL